MGDKPSRRASAGFRPHPAGHEISKEAIFRQKKIASDAPHMPVRSIPLRLRVILR